MLFQISLYFFAVGFERREAALTSTAPENILDASKFINWSIL